MPQPHVFAFVQHLVPTKGVHEFVHLETMQPPLLELPPELLDPELLLLPELLVEEPLLLLEEEAMQKPALQVIPAVCVQSVHATPPVPQFGSTWFIWQVPALSQQPVQVVLHEPLSSPVGAS